MMDIHFQEVIAGTLKGKTVKDEHIISNYKKNMKIHTGDYIILVSGLETQRFTFSGTVNKFAGNRMEIITDNGGSMSVCADGAVCVMKLPRRF